MGGGGERRQADGAEAPRVIPVIDKHVITALQAPKGKYWTTLRDSLG